MQQLNHTGGEQGHTTGSLIEHSGQSQQKMLGAKMLHELVIQLRTTIPKDLQKDQTP